MRDPRASRHDRDYPRRGDRHDDDPRGHRRSRTAEDPNRYRRASPDQKSRDYPPRDDRDRDRDRRGGYAKTRGRDPSPTPGGRTRTRDFADGPDRDGDRDRHGGHGARSHGKDKPTSKDIAAAEPPRGREKHMTSGAGGTGARAIGAKVRSSTMPAAQTAAKWWKNPLVQAGARTALSAGATAAMNNRGVQGEWLGAKGAKVATAALGAALMDGFMGGGGGDRYKKKGDGGGGGGERERGRARSSSRDRDRDRDRSRERSSRGGGGKSSGRSKSEGGRGDMKHKIMQSGMDYMLKKATAAR